MTPPRKRPTTFADQWLELQRALLELARVLAQEANAAIERAIARHEDRYRGCG